MNLNPASLAALRMQTSMARVCALIMGDSGTVYRLDLLNTSLEREGIDPVFGIYGISSN